MTSRSAPWRQLGYVLGEAALSLISSGILFIIISRVAGPELLGRYALAVAWLALFQGVSSCGIPEYLIREVGSHGRGAAGQVFHAMLLGLGSSVVAMCLMLVAVRSIDYSAENIEFVSIASLALVPAFLNTACRSVFLALREMQLTLRAFLVEVLIVMAASTYIVFAQLGALPLICVLVAGKIASGSIACILIYRHVLPLRPSFDPVFLMRTARIVFTFGIGNMLGMLTMRINTIMVSLWAGITTVGHFAAATKVMEIGLIVPHLFTQLLMSRIAHSFNMHRVHDPNRFGSWYRVLFGLVIPACVGGWIYAGPILNAVFGTGFGEASWILRILLLYLLIESADATMSVILKAAQRQREDTVRLAFNPGVNIALSLLLIPYLGPIGAAIGRVSGVAVSAALRHTLIIRALIGVHWLRFAAKPALIAIGAGALSYVLFDNRPGLALLFYGAVTAVLLRLVAGLSPAVVKDMMSPSSGTT